MMFDSLCECLKCIGVYLPEWYGGINSVLDGTIYQKCAGQQNNNQALQGIKSNCSRLNMSSVLFFAHVDPYHEWSQLPFLSLYHWQVYLEWGKVPWIVLSNQLETAAAKGPLLHLIFSMEHDPYPPRLKNLLLPMQASHLTSCNFSSVNIILMFWLCSLPQVLVVQLLDLCAEIL